MSCVSFQDVIRQRAERAQGVIEDLEKETLELLVRFKFKVNQQVIKDGDGRDVLREEVRDLSDGIGLDQGLVDELLDKLRQHVGLKSVPVLMGTAEKKKDNIIEALQAGVNNYILKPFNAQTLEEKLNRIFP